MMQSLVFLQLTMLLLLSDGATIVRKREQELYSVGDPNSIYFLLSTRENPLYDNAEVMKLGNISSVLDSNFNASWPVKMVSIGWTYPDAKIGAPDLKNTKAAQDWANAYFQVGNYNFIEIVWQMIALNDTDVIPATRIAGKHAAAFIDFLIETTGVPLGAFHVIGHSSGAHIAGATGLGYREAHNFTSILPRCTGLDPADYTLVGFDMSSSDDYIDATDAQFVDITHTDGNYLGIYRPIGTADFYFNGGLHQPGCPLDINDPIICDHLRAYFYWQESIITEIGFVSYQCPSLDDFINGTCYDNDFQLVGEFLSTNARGNYHLNTNRRSPFALGPVQSTQLSI